MKTLRAIRLFQQEDGLPVDGRVSSGLLRYMQNLARPGPPATPSKSAAAAPPRAALPRPQPPPATAKRPAAAPALAASAPKPQAPTTPTPTPRPATPPTPVSAPAAAARAPAPPAAAPARAAAPETPPPAAPAPRVAAAAPAPPASAAPAATSAAPPAPAATPAKPASAAPAAQVAAKPAAAESPAQAAGEKAPSIHFAPGSAELTEPVKAELDKLAGRLAKSNELRLQLYAYYAGATEAQAEQARLLSYRRSLNVRDYLINQGVSDERIGLRLLGSKPPDDGSANRVDPVFIAK